MREFESREGKKQSACLYRVAAGAEAGTTCSGLFAELANEADKQAALRAGYAERAGRLLGVVLG